MNELDMEEIGHKVVRLEERFTYHSDEISEIKDVAKSLLETSRYQSHAIDQILKELENDRVSKSRVHDIEIELARVTVIQDKHDKRIVAEEAKSIETDKMFSQAKLVWKIAYTIVTTPVLIMVGIKALEFFSKGHA